MENAKHQSVQEVREQRLSVGTKAIFGMGDYLNTVTYGMIAAFLMAFLTDTIMIPMAAVTAIMSLSKLWDAVNDPIIGVIIDKSRSRWGVYRPWVLFGAIPFAISNIIIWAPIGHWSEGAKIGYVSVVYCLYMVFFTAYHIAYGSLGGTMEMVWDQELGQYVMRPIDNGQTTLFDQSGEGSGPIMDADYTVVDDPPALPAGTAALPAPQEEPEVAGLDSEETKERWDTFYWLLNFDGTPMKVLEAMGNYTVRTEANKVILTSANPHTTLYCSGEILSSHVGHRLVCKASGKMDGNPDTVSIICEECDDTLFELHSPAWTADEESVEPGEEVPEDYPYEAPGEEGE
jgi:hypothetical protein